ncbi:hypothetical protein [Terricaulis sp.]|uniref:hypothetical protein n=1 Tax=Terricaulis sp. TaxID=2768686 RepID=UPI0037833450
MSSKWVDNPDYIGPDRRTRPGPKRWKERRHLDETSGQRPALGALMRRLRVVLTGLALQDDRRKALQLISAAVLEAERQHFYQCADHLKAAEKMLRAGEDFATVDTRVVEAVDRAAAGQ